MKLIPPQRSLNDINFFQDETYTILFSGERKNQEFHEIKKNGKKLAQYVVIRRKLRIFPATVEWIQFGPKILSTEPGTNEYIFKQIRKDSSERGALYIAVQSYLSPTGPTHQELEAWGFQPRPEHFLFRHTVLVKLNHSEEEILKSFSRLVRRELYAAEEAKVEVHFNEDPSFVEIFFDLYRSTHVRTREGFHPKSYFHNIWEHLVPRHEAVFGISYVSGKPASALMTAIVDGNMICLYGGTTVDPELLLAKPNKKLHWEMIKLGKTWGCPFFDLGGLTPGAQKGEKSAGIAQFKMLFSKDVVSLPGLFRSTSHPLQTGILDLYAPLVAKWRRKSLAGRESDYTA